MDIVEYAETIFGVKLLDYQKVLLKKMYEAYKNNKDMRIITNCHNTQFYFYTYLKQNNLPICKELSQRVKGELT